MVFLGITLHSVNMNQSRKIWAAIQKQPPEVLHKKWSFPLRISSFFYSEVLSKKNCSWKLFNIHRETPVLESLFKKVAGLQHCTFVKKRIQHNDFPVNIAKFLRTSANDCFKLIFSSYDTNEVHVPEKRAAQLSVV